VETSTKRAGQGHLVANQALMCVAGVLSAMSLLSVLLNLLMSVATTTTSGPLDGVYPVPADTWEQTGFYGTFVCIGVFALIGMVWTPINAWGLFKRKRWARISSVAYWAVTLLTCACIPLGAYGIWSLSRRDVRALLDR
jgi:hypothetical protein